DLDDPALWNIAMGNIACMLKLTPNTVATTPWVFTGKAWLDASLDVKATGAVSVTGNWVAAGAWAKTPESCVRAGRDFTVTGVGGTITWHYFPAADVVAFTITCDRDERWSLRATIVNGNAYNLAQTPLLFRMPRLRGTWCWPLLRVERVDATLTA